LATILTEQLSKVGLFAELTREELDELADCLRLRHYNAGRIIFGEGDPGAHLYLVAAGRVSVEVSAEDGRNLVFHTFGPGEVFGELALLDGEPRSADAVAQEPCDLLLLSRADFLRFLDVHPGVAIRLLAVLSRYLRQTNQQAQGIAFLDVPARLARLLLLLGETGNVRASSKDGKTRTFLVTQRELASRIGATRETVNRCLSQFEEQGLIRCERGRVTILRPDVLEKRV
jgi:CRP-like cAMP-binding protein